MRTPNHPFLLSLVASALALATVSPAQDSTPPAATGGVDAAGRPWVEAVRVETGPRIDGRLDDPAWQRAGRSDHFFQVEPVEKGPPSERTELFVCYDSDHLYLGIRCHDRDPSGIITTQLERDARLDPDDRIEIVLDTFHDQRFAYFFQVNVGGARGDGLISPTGFAKAWDGIFRAMGAQDDGGWSAEFAIPFKTVAFRANASTWGLNVVRNIRRRNETVRWSEPLQNRSPFDPSTAGDIRGLVGVDPGAGVDARPFLAAKTVRDRVSGRRYTTLSPGFDGFVRLSRSTTAALTINTDFADTEVDERQINLTRFPLFFPEKRDFFLQDTSIFGFGGNGDVIPFFTRRIGLTPSGREVPIDLGLKVTGREGPVNFGFLDVQTAPKGAIDAENMFVGRVSVNVFEKSSVGLIFTRGDPTSTSRHEVGGFDFEYEVNDFLGDQRLDVGAFFLKSWAADGGDRDLSYGASIAYPNDLIDARLEATEIQRDFEARLGFVPRSDVRRYSGRFAVQPRPGGAVRRLRFRVESDLFTGTDSIVQSGLARLTFFQIELESGDELRMSVQREFDRLTQPFAISERATLPIGRYYWTRGTIAVETSEARPVSGNARYSSGEFYSGRLNEYFAEVVVRPSRYWNVSLSGLINDVDLPEGDFITRLYRLRFQIATSAALSWTNFVQYDNVSDDIGLNSRLRWNLQPGSDIFFVVNQGWHRDGNSIVPTINETTIKAEYTFRF